MKNKANIKYRRIESAGIPKYYNQAITELIIKSFDDIATKVYIIFESNKIDHINPVGRRKIEMDLNLIMGYKNI